MKLFAKYTRGAPRTRVNKAGEWRCFKCRKHKPPSAYYRMKPYNRPQSMCIACGRIQARDAMRKMRNPPPPPRPATLRGSRY